LWVAIIEPVLKFLVVLISFYLQVILNTLINTLILQPYFLVVTAANVCDVYRLHCVHRAGGMLLCESVD